VFLGSSLSNLVEFVGLLEGSKRRTLVQTVHYIYIYVERRKGGKDVWRQLTRQLTESRRRETREGLSRFWCLEYHRDTCPDDEGLDIGNRRSIELLIMYITTIECGWYGKKNNDIHNVYSCTIQKVMSVVCSFYFLLFYSPQRALSPA